MTQVDLTFFSKKLSPLTFRSLFFCNSSFCSTLVALKEHKAGKSVPRDLEKLKDVKQGLCLDCLNTDGIARQKKECRVPHPEGKT